MKLKNFITNVIKNEEINILTPFIIVVIYYSSDLFYFDIIAGIISII